MRADRRTESLRHRHSQKRRLDFGDWNCLDQSATFVADQICLVATLDWVQATATIFVPEVGMRNDWEIFRVQQCCHARILTTRHVSPIRRRRVELEGNPVWLRGGRKQTVWGMTVTKASLGAEPSRPEGSCNATVPGSQILFFSGCAKGFRFRTGAASSTAAILV
jgi:hypothetical protein